MSGFGTNLDMSTLIVKHRIDMKNIRKVVESEALKALKEDHVEIWLSELLALRILPKKEQKKDREDILYSYEIEKIPSIRLY